MRLMILVVLLSAPYMKSSPENYMDVMREYESNQRVLRAALENGLELSDAYDLTIKLMGTSIDPPKRENVAYWEQKDFPFLGFLTQILETTDMPLSRPPYTRHHVSQITVLNWIAVSQHPECTDWLIKYAEELLKKPIESDEDVERLKGTLKALGYNGSEQALDMLFHMQSKRAWENGDCVDLKSYEGSSRKSQQSIVFELRAAALTGIAFSGTERALKAFATGEGLADDMGRFDGEFCIAAHARFGLYNLSWHYQNGLAPEVEAELKSVYDKYHMEYRAKEQFGPITDPTRPPRPSGF